AGVPVELAARLLDRLAAVHLLDRPAAGRYRFHDLLRLYARGRADAEDSAAARDMALRDLCAWYVDGVAAAAALLYPQMLRLPADHAADHAAAPPSRLRLDDPGAALRWLDSERANLVAIIAQAPQHRLAAAAWRLADLLRGYFWLRR